MHIGTVWEGSYGTRDLLNNVVYKKNDCEQNIQDNLDEWVESQKANASEIDPGNTVIIIGKMNCRETCNSSRTGIFE